MKRGSDLDAFLLSFRTEGERELDRIKQEVEEQIADLIALRRREIETQIKEIREEHQEKISSHKKNLELKLRGEIQRKIDEMQENLLARAKSDIEKKLDEVRSSSLYGEIINSFFNELVQDMGQNATFYVPRSELARFSSTGLNVIPCDFEDNWGGCTAIDSQGGVVLENTFECRLDRLFPDVAREITKLFNENIEKNQFIKEQLRIS